jgi:hypothetical protein
MVMSEPRPSLKVSETPSIEQAEGAGYGGVATNLDEIESLLSVKDLERLSLGPSSIRQLLGMPPPEDFFRAALAVSTFRRLSDKLFALWNELFKSYVVSADEQISFRCAGCGKETTLRANAIWSRACLVLGSYYDFCLIRGLKSEKGTLPRAFNINVIEKFGVPAEIKDDHPRVPAGILANHYLRCVATLYFIRALQKAGAPRSVSGPFESLAHRALAMMVGSAASSGPFKVLSERLTYSLIKELSEVYEPELTVDSKYSPGVFSSLRLSEVGLLSRREPRLLKKYGENRVEKLFERQLALILQSFGFFVVETRIGARTVDLICISSSATTRGTFLVEAKTTAEPYNLPVKDERALLEYAAEVRKNLASLPELEFVLIVGHGGAKTLGARLRTLEGKLRLPVRFLSADQLVALRERLPCPLEFSTLKDAVVSSSHVVPPEFVEQIGARVRTQHEAHEQFVRILLHPQETMPPGPKAWGESCTTEPSRGPAEGPSRSNGRALKPE